MTSISTRSRALQVVPETQVPQGVLGLFSRAWSYRGQVLFSFYLMFVGFALGCLWIVFSKDQKEQQVAQISLPFVEQKIPVQTHVAVPPVVKVSAPETPQPIQAVWQKNSVAPLPASFGMNKIALIIDDLGIVKNRSWSFVKMDAPLTLSFLPYATDLRRMTGAARERGHEIMVHMPMEPRGRENPGPHALLTNLSPQEQLERLDYNLSRFDGFVGINNHMGSAFTEDAVAVNRMLGVIKKRGLLVLDSRTSGGSLLAGLASARNIPNVVRDVFLDNRQDEEYILRQLKKLEQQAEREGHAVGIGHPYPQTLAVLKKWLPTLKDRGIAIVPLSEIVRQKYRQTYNLASATRSSKTKKTQTQ